MACVIGLAMLAGCSSVPDAVNPVEWYKSTRDVIVGEPKDDSEEAEEPAAPPPGADEPIPNLASVPDRPKTSTPVDRKSLASGLMADQQSGRRYSNDVIQRQGDLPQPPPPARPTPTPAPQAATTPAPTAPVAPAPSAAPTPEQVKAAAPPPPASVQAAPTPPPAAAPVQPAQVAAVPPPGAPRTPPQMRDVTAANIAPGTAQPIQPSNIVVPRENPQAPKLNPVTPYVPPADLDQTETVYIGGSGSSGGASRSGNVRAATPASYRTLPPSGVIASEVPGTRPLATFSGANSRGSYQVASIQFADGSAKLSDHDRAVLKGVIDQQRKTGGTLRIVGHASSRTGTSEVDRHAETNMRVSAERAEVVARELVRQGGRPDTMYVGAVSDADPKYFEFMPTGEAGNRRAEIFIDF
jgi:outer membrane protein OmpA-like peptidoglycan-associated protein